jgi:hypothetical protein
MKNNYDNNIIYFEKIIEEETNKPLEIYVENNQIQLFHKVTGRHIMNYVPSSNFQELANAFILYNIPVLSISEIQDVQKIFEKYNINLKF